MLETLVFDSTYYVLSGAMITLLTAGTVLGLKFRGENRPASVGMGLTALGALITISETVFLLALSRNGSIGSFLYEQARFSVAYLAFGLFLYGWEKGLLSRMFSGDKLKRARIISWSAYALSIAGSSLFLFNP